MILEGVFAKTKDMTHNGRIYPQSIFDREYRLKIRKIRASRRRTRIMRLFIK